MKKSLSVLFAIVFVLSLATIALATTVPGTGIDATFHDMSTNGASAALGETADHNGLNRICVYCHAPHNTNKPDTGLNKYRPLWNHDPSLQTAFDMYSNGTDVPNQVAHQSQAMVALSGVTAPGSVSMLCLSCHDGTAAVNSYGYVGNTGAGRGTGGNTVSARAVIGGPGGILGGDLSNHHPIGFPYAAAYPADDEIADPATSGHLLDATIGVKAGGPQTINDLLWNGNVECVSCHDVHNTKNGGTKFTWVQDRQSALCITCHLKVSPTFAP